MKKKLKYGLIAIAVLIPVSFIVGHELAVRSEPFAILKSNIMASSEVEHVVGQVKQISLGWLGYMVKYSGPSGKASFDTTVVGNKGSVRIYADLNRSAGEWKINKINISELR